MLFPQFVEGVTLMPRIMVSAWLSRDDADAIMSKLRHKSRLRDAAPPHQSAAHEKAESGFSRQPRFKLLESITLSAFGRFRPNAA
ncbi:MAG: hypothetical protein HYS63_01290 [Methylocystis sp.]|nr:hypothetical protein [Methylocystis sp.]